ncbi:phosphate ABC transporter substrate-binding protein PstS [Phenylobacterium deserti]|uniref:Phosphate-binding protein PstS n=1 Tax=Phenylobacterium deserti TaxID=1914756 RepID=A0A328AD26_9CAUL|nr:phosphate ABC transporter substrate-binding protein PstS [Phenylobacterium deserti]RAK52540.1 phosphate ABC transporter substrate-binding protein PstS [Phenylobacterium deserti]
MLKLGLSTGVALMAGVLLLAGCNKPAGDAKAGGQGPAAASASISGAGATFPAPLYARWAETYRASSGLTLNYQAIGSGGGVKQIQAKTVDFGASDKPMKPEDLDKAGLYQFPTVMGGVVPVVNLPGVQPGQLKLSGPVLADIYLGQIKSWRAPQIAALNPGVNLPNLPITVVHRSDGSGTSFLFTTYLAGKSPAWAQRVGASDAVEWPAGIGGKGNDGVAAFVKQTGGAIGYVEFAYATQNKLTFTQLQNRDGAFVSPTAAAFAAAAAGADWANAPGNYLLLIDQAGGASWPITGATFILVHRQQADAAKGRAVLSFFDWAYKNGDQGAAQLDYVPLPAAVKDLVRSQWANVKGPDGQPVYTGG